MKTLLLATHNPAKFEELSLGVRSVFQDKVKIVSLDDLKIAEEPNESGNTFEENSRLKAEFYGQISRLPTIGDDGGLIIPTLNNGPGVKSRRWLGYEASDEELISYTLKQMAGMKNEKRIAYLETCLCFFDPASTVELCEQEKIKGYVAEKPTGRPTNGYPFRALFIVEKFNKFYDELTIKEHEEINHRLIALKRLLLKVRKFLVE